MKRDITFKLKNNVEEIYGMFSLASSRNVVV